MAHKTERVGAHSHYVAMSAFIANGWEVAEPAMPEVYDLLVRKRGGSRWQTVQIKTAYYRKDRDSVIIYARRSNGEPYTPEEVDLMVGVYEGDTVYVVPCTGLTEYWSAPSKLAKWQVLSGQFEGRG